MEILASLPGTGRIVLAALLAEAFHALQRRDYAALRTLTGVAPVTKRSGQELHRR
ncbi:transposase [Sinorhizobium meliloti]|uniref:transposase n=1 Tax=Rhizobium meliloti TaxID=382 RepID=UPI0013E2B6A7|nr:transposase [Sinorhizobium meliloti]